MADETMTLEQVRDSLRRIGAHPNSLFSKWERAIEAAIAERKVPDGWQLVPIEPTVEMAQAACDLCCPEGVGNDLESGRLQHSPALKAALVKVYTAMLSAAPKVTP